MQEQLEKIISQKDTEVTSLREFKNKEGVKKFENIENILADLNYEGLRNARTTVLEKMQEVGDNPEMLEHLGNYLVKVSAKISRIKDLEGITSESFDELNTKKMIEFTKNGLPVVVEAENHGNYLLIHGNMLRDQETGELNHYVETPDGAMNTAEYIIKMLGDGKIKSGSILNVASCYIGEMTDFDELAELAQTEYGVILNRVTDKDGAVQASIQDKLSPQDRLNALKNDVEIGNVSFKAVKV